MPWGELLTGGRFLQVAELRPPKGVRTEAFVSAAEALRGRVDAVLVPDNADAVMVLDARTAARLVLQAGSEPVLGLSCRDRNRLALQSDLLGAWVDGIRSVVVEAGVDPSLGDHPGTRGVYDLDPDRFVAAVRRLGEGFDAAGGRLDGAAGFVVGAEVDPWQPVVVPGVDFRITRPVYDAETFAAVAAPLRDLGVPVLVRVVLLKSGGMARWIQRNVAPGRVAAATIERLQKAPDKGEASVAIAADLVRAVRASAAGVCLVPLGWEARIPAVLDAAR